MNASPIEKRAVKERSRSTMRPLSAARTATTSAIGSTGDNSKLLAESAMTAQPMTLTVHTYSRTVGFPSRSPNKRVITAHRFASEIPVLCQVSACSSEVEVS